MNRFSKIASCLLAFLLFVYLMLIDYPRLKASLAVSDSSAVSGVPEDEGSSSTSDAEKLPEGGDASAEAFTDSEAEETAALEAQAAALEQELEELREQCGPVQVGLFFDQSDDVVYGELYPAMTAAGYTGTIVFQDGALTGNYQIIETSEFKTMNAAGWEYAIGGDSADLDLTGTYTTKDWQTSLESYIRALRARTGITPTLYVFRDGEYQAECEATLEDLGYTALAYSAADAATDTTESALDKLTWFRVSAETDAEALLEELQSCSCAVLLAEVDEADSTDEDAFLVEEYIELLKTLETEETVTITAGSTVLEAAEDGERQTLLDQIQQKEEELAQVQAQLE